MNSMQHLFRPALKRIIFRAWCSLLRLGRSALSIAGKTDRRVSCGRIGERTAYVIHASPFPRKTGEAIQDNIRRLVARSEERFLNGDFFVPIAEQIDQQSAVITAIARQGGTETPTDHVIAIFPAQP